MKDKKRFVEVIKTTLGLELHVESFEGITEFYESLGFEVLFFSPGNYLTLALNEVVISFWGDGGRFKDQHYFKNFPKTSKKGFAVEIKIPVPDIEEYYKTVKDKVKLLTPLVLQRWGFKDFRIEDVNGFYICFTEPHDWMFDFKGYISDQESM